MYDGLAVLGLESRAALVASAIERFEPMDTETILGASPPATRKVIGTARDRYLQSVHGKSNGWAGGSEPPDGDIAKRVREATERAMAPGWTPQ
jgi:hypothetical protein